MANEKGGMNSEIFRKYILKLVGDLYPDAANVDEKHVIIKIDGGPGRLDFCVATELRLHGIYLFPTVPNTTQVSQETDQKYGLFQSNVRAVLIIIFQEEGKVNRYHVPVLINGREASEGKPAIPSPYALAFEKERNLRIWNQQVGAVQATHACLQNPKVRVEKIPEAYKQFVDAGQNDNVQIEYSWNNAILENLTELETQNQAAIEKLIEWNFNGDAFSRFALTTEQPRMR
jgi:hypothetical protein